VFLDGRRVEVVDGLRSDHFATDGATKRVSVTAGDFIRGKQSLQLTMKGTDRRGLIDTQSGETVPLPKALAAPGNAARGDLYLVSIGVNQYPFLDQDLKYAKQDAQAFHAWVLQNHAADFNAVHAFLLHDTAPDKPTKRRIEAVLEELKSAKPEDTVILFMAGHGKNIGPDYYFLSSDAEADGGHLATGTAVHWQKIQHSLAQAAGLRLLVVDTCYAKGAFNPTLVNNASAARIAVFSATENANYVAEEQAGLGHGVFTYSLLQGLQGRADSKDWPDKKIALHELESFLYGAVQHHTQGRQTPGIELSPEAKHYVIAHLDNAAD
jgi:uncharacterized caspase-like protein